MLHFVVGCLKNKVHLIHVSKHYGCHKSLFDVVKNWEIICTHVSCNAISSYSLPCIAPSLRESGCWVLCVAKVLLGSLRRVFDNSAQNPFTHKKCNEWISIWLMTVNFNIQWRHFLSVRGLTNRSTRLMKWLLKFHHFILNHSKKQRTK